jgi:hypothetical protein
MYAYVLETSGRFSAGCAHPATPPLISTTHPPATRELISVYASRNKLNGAGSISSAPFARSYVKC